VSAEGAAQSVHVDRPAALVLLGYAGGPQVTVEHAQQTRGDSEERRLRRKPHRHGSARAPRFLLPQPQLVHEPSTQVGRKVRPQRDRRALAVLLVRGLECGARHRPFELERPHCQGRQLSLPQPRQDERLVYLERSFLRRSFWRISSARASRPERRSAVAAFVEVVGRGRPDLRSWHDRVRRAALGRGNTLSSMINGPCAELLSNPEFYLGQPRALRYPAASVGSGLSSIRVEEARRPHDRDLRCAGGSDDVRP
jgi:hypothetical protein